MPDSDQTVQQGHGTDRIEPVSARANPLTNVLVDTRAESQVDVHWMHEALRWARRGLYTTMPNPRVGCVLVRDQKLIGAGFTQPPGQAHAEVQALNDARTRGLNTAGATAYVTLEPCAHQGRTPPCTDALIDAGIKCVVAAIQDPDPRVAGRGFAQLRKAGVEVRVGVLEAPARALNAGFLSRIERGRPWVRLKLASSLDGRAALQNGDSQWITSMAARRDGHRWRARACAILTGSGTALRDNPRLSVRHIAAPRQPRRILLDSRLQVPGNAHLYDTSEAVWVFTAQAKPAADTSVARLPANAQLTPLPNASGRVDLPALMAELGRREINEVHVEAGPALAGALLQAGLVDELLWYVAPTLLGNAKSLFDLPEVASLESAWRWRFIEQRRVGSDLRVRAVFESPGTSAGSD